MRYLWTWAFVTSPLWRWKLQPICCFATVLKISIPSSKRLECGNPERISKRSRKPVLWLSKLSTPRHFHRGVGIATAAQPLIEIPALIELVNVAFWMRQRYFAGESGPLILDGARSRR
jgi:hypothetical protein